MGWKLATKFSVFASDAGRMPSRTRMHAAAGQGGRAPLDRRPGVRRGGGSTRFYPYEAGADAPTSGEPAAAVYNRTARFFRGVAAELEWEELYFSQTDDGEQIDCAYKKRLRRRRHPPGHSRLANFCTDSRAHPT